MTDLLFVKEQHGVLKKFQCAKLLLLNTEMDSVASVHYKIFL